MISPDVWSLKPPNTLITHNLTQLTEKAEKCIQKNIDSHHFNRLVSIEM